MSTKKAAKKYRKPTCKTKREVRLSDNPEAPPSERGMPGATHRQARATGYRTR